MIIANSKTKGNTSELLIATKFISNGFLVSFPFGDNAPYDLIVDNGNRLYKVQSKTAHLHTGQVEIPLERRVGNKRIGTESYIYLGIDFVCGYSPDYDKYYIVDLKYFKNTSSILLRVTPPLNNMKKGINFAENFLFEKVIQRF